MKKLLFSLFAFALSLQSQAQVVTNDYGTTSSETVQSFTGPQTEITTGERVNGVVMSFNYLDFDLSSIAISWRYLNYNGIGGGLNMRTNLKDDFFDFGDFYNWDLYLNYTAGLSEGKDYSLLLNCSFGPSYGQRKEYFYNSKGKLDYKNKGYIDGFADINLMLNYKSLYVNVGYAIWGTEFKFKKGYKEDGFMVGIGFHY